MKRLFALVLTLVMFVIVGVVTSNAQTINDEVRVSAGITRVEDVNVFTGRGELRKELSERFMFNDVFTLDASTDVTRVRNTALLRFSPVEHLFVAGGIGVGKVTDDDVFVNPTAQLGANFSVGKVNFEPFMQLETPDIVYNDDNSRSLSVNLNVKVGVSDRFGFIGIGQLRSTRLDNRFFQEGFTSLEKTATAGVYFNF